MPTLDERIEILRRANDADGGWINDAELHRLVLDLADERERLRAALAAIAEDRVPPYEPVRSNRCVHRRTMDEDCKHCVKAFARAGLNQETPDADA